MIKSILLKEYCKIRTPWLTLFVLHCCITGYIFIDIRHLFIVYRPEMVWYQVMHLGQIHHYEVFKYIPTVVGVLLACAQFFPEMRDERLRLTLHLPVSPHRLIMAHILIGLLATSAIVLPNLLALVLITTLYFPPEVGLMTLGTATPWVYAGCTAYLGGSAALLEPGNKLRLCTVGITAGVTGLFLFPAGPGGYNNLLLILLIPLLLMFFSVLLPAYHFRFRKVSE